MAIFVLGGLIWIARSDFQNNTISIKSNGILTVEEANNYNFGAISMAAGKVKHQFKIKNIGSESVIINKIYTSCMCTTAKLIVGDKQFGPYGMPGHAAVPKINGEINPDKEAIIEVVFDPAAHGPAGVGQIQRIITLENDASQPVELRFEAIVTP